MIDDEDTIPTEGRRSLRRTPKINYNIIALESRAREEAISESIVIESAKKSRSLFKTPKKEFHQVNVKRVQTPGKSSSPFKVEHLASLVRDLNMEESLDNLKTPKRRGRPRKDESLLKTQSSTSRISLPRSARKSAISSKDNENIATTSKKSPITPLKQINNRRSNRARKILSYNTNSKSNDKNDSASPQIRLDESEDEEEDCDNVNDLDYMVVSSQLSPDQDEEQSPDRTPNRRIFVKIRRTPKNSIKKKPEVTRSTAKRRLPDEDFEEDCNGTQSLRPGDVSVANLTCFDASDQSDEISENEDESENARYRLNYFVASSNRGKTSNNTLKDLDLRSLNRKFFKSITLEQEAHMKEKYLQKLFPRVFNLLVEQFNVILYGFGSKKELLDEFQREWLGDEHSVFIYGFFAEISLKHVLNNLALPIGCDEVDEDSIINAASIMEHDLYIVIHSMDLLFTNEPRIKRFFYNLIGAASEHIKIIASVDHLHSSLMYDNSENKTFNWIWQDATTFQNYQLERAYLASTNKSSRNQLQSSLEWQSLTISSLTHVYNSLTPNAKEIFLIILKEWLAHHVGNEQDAEEFDEDDEHGGILFSKLYQMCREAFVVNSDLTLRTQLTEFKDHELLQVKKTAGVETIQVLVDKKVIQKFLEKIN